jgi:adhesin/invasin
VTEVPLNTPQSVKIHWDEAGVPQVGKTINFFATRGNFAATPTCPMITVCTTDANGDAIASISANNAGPAVISSVAAGASGPTSQISIEFISTMPTSLILQATLTSLAVNQQSVITAVVRDAQGNLVKDETVSFSLTDVSGGRISPASAVTDSFGRASTVYTAGAVPSANNGVVITATAAGTPGDTIRLTVAQQALFVVLGTANSVQELSSTQYALAYSVLVTDANGNPVANATVALNVLPIQYNKGSCGAPTITCPSEDSNRNGILDLGEDVNNNRTLEPGNVATVPTTVTTSATGFAFFDVVYAQEFAGLVEIELDARTVVVGSEGASQAQFFLPGGCVFPPSPPFGTATSCANPN